MQPLESGQQSKITKAHTPTDLHTGEQPTHLNFAKTVAAFGHCGSKLSLSRGQGISGGLLNF
jgi:hypothetical protein